MLITIFYDVSIMDVTPSNVLIFGLLIIGVAHIMIIQNGHWDHSILLITFSSVIILITVHRHMKINEKKNKVRRIKKNVNI